MTAVEFDTTAPPGPRGRTIKFTPERLAQIRNLVERGMSREDIAASIGVTVGSLQVTCSRLNISLRPPRDPSGPRLPSAKPGPRPQTVLVPGPQTVAAASDAAMVLRMQHGGRTRDFPVPITTEALSTLVLMAAVKGISLGELLAKVLTAAVRDGV